MPDKEAKVTGTRELGNLYHDLLAAGLPLDLAVAITQEAAFRMLADCRLGG